jgi:hypothetical protein
MKSTNDNPVTVTLTFRENSAGSITIDYTSTDRAVGIFTVDAICRALGVEPENRWIQ